MGFEQQVTYYTAVPNMTLWVDELGKSIDLPEGAALKYIGKRRPNMSYPPSDAFRYKGYLGIVHPNDNGTAFEEFFLRAKQRKLPEFEPYDPNKHKGGEHAEQT